MADKTENKDMMDSSDCYDNLMTVAQMKEVKSLENFAGKKEVTASGK